jgi:hypothetical protein
MSRAQDHQCFEKALGSVAFVLHGLSAEKLSRITQVPRRSATLPERIFSDGGDGVSFFVYDEHVERTQRGEKATTTAAVKAKDRNFRIAEPPAAIEQ